MTPLQKQRIEKGQCPNCGNEAAPYRLCWKCRKLGQIRRACIRLEQDGHIRAVKEGGKYHYWFRPEAKDKPVDNRWATLFDGDPEKDRRLQPRLRGIRVNVEATLIEVMKVIGRPCTLEEIMAGWGRLRAKRDAPLANDLARIIAAEDKRRRRAEKRSSGSEVVTT